jgi:small subunit ribosomal protein S20
LANITQQKKRNRRSLKQRESNIRYTSTIKTLFKRIEEVAGSDDHTELDARQQALSKIIDRAAAKGAIHKNTASRKKSRVARLIQRSTSDTSTAA